MRERDRKADLNIFSPFHKSSCAVVNMMNERIKRERGTERHRKKEETGGGGFRGRGKGNCLN